MMLLLILFLFGMYLPTTVGSRSTKMARGTCFPELVSEKKVLNESSATPTLSSDGIWPSGCIPCSKQYSSQQAFPIWTPAWPTWIEITSLILIWLCYSIKKQYTIVLKLKQYKWVNVYHSKYHSKNTNDNLFILLIFYTFGYAKTWQILLLHDWYFLYPNSSKKVN